MAEASVTARTVDDHSVVVEVRGDVDPAATALLSRIIVAAVARHGGKRLLLDLRGVGHLDAQGVGAVVAGNDVAVDRGVTLVVHGAGQALADRLRAAGLPAACFG